MTSPDSWSFTTDMTPTISWPNPANIVYGTALGSTQLDATANVAGTFAYCAGLGHGTQGRQWRDAKCDIHAD